MPQTKREIRMLLAGAGISPNRRLGQNFLIDGNLMRRLVASAQIGPADVVLEVGPGTGSLTEMLLDVAAYVVAVEVDAGLFGVLQGRLAGRANLTLIGTDALAAKSRLAPELADAVRAASGRTSGRCLLVANLPYQIASPLLLDLLLSDLGVRRFCFTVQQEVADRIASPPGRKSYSPLSIVIQAVCDVTHVADLPASVFWPRPKIASTMLRLDFSEAKAARIADLPHFVHVVRTCFLHRRKQLAHAVAYLFGRKKLDTVEAFGGMDLTRRPEALSVEEWIALAQQIPPEPPA